LFLQPEDTKPAESEPLGKSVLPEPGNTSYLLELKVSTEVASFPGPEKRRRLERV